MTISERINKFLTRQGRTKKWAAEVCGVNYKTFIDRLLNDRLTAYDLIRLCDEMLIDINTFKDKN